MFSKTEKVLVAIPAAFAIALFVLLLALSTVDYINNFKSPVMSPELESEIRMALSQPGLLELSMLEMGFGDCPPSAASTFWPDWEGILYLDPWPRRS